MNRRKVLKNILTTFSLPFIPLGLIPKDERVSTAGVVINPYEKIEEQFWAGQTDRDAAYINHMYPELWEYDIKIIYDEHSEKSKQIKTWIN